MSRVPAALQHQVRQRAGACCEYCQLPEAFSPARFEADHIIAVQHGGETILRNLAWTCFGGNRHKLSNLAGIDPKTRRRTWLFNPRRQKWPRHFRWEGATLLGRTPVGRATIAVLGINLSHHVALRAALIAEGVFPPSP
jgi:hypothetical protein